jgi:hypothetical protein
MNALLLMLRFFLIGLLLATVFCTGDRLAGGGTIETTNGLVAGKIVYPNGDPAPKSLVKLIPERFNPYTDTAAIPVDTTDDSGRYVFASVSSGVYTIQSVQSIKRTRAIAFGISLTQGALSVASMTLQLPGAVKVMLPGGAHAITAYVYVPGSDIAMRVQGTGGFVILDSVPAGVLPSVSFAPTIDSTPSVIRYDIRVLSGDTVALLNPSWRYARSITLNTKPSGADVAATEIDFPALIRLTRSTFDFSQAQKNGGDIRFTKTDNTPLPYEIERWDGAAGLAEVWVKVDTIQGNDSMQGIIMYWGALAESGALAAATSNGAAVFDTSEGFQAVLHMNQSVAGKATDATANHFDGAVSGSALNASLSGPIGLAADFSGSAGNIQLSGTAQSKLSFQQYGTYTIAAWVRADSIFTGDQHIVGKGGLQYSLRIKGAQSSPPSKFSFEEYVETPLKGFDRRLSPVILTDWKYLVAVRNRSSAYLFVDGVCTDSTGTFYVDNVAANARDSSSDVTIGSFSSGGLHFSGAIDEVRLMSVPLSPDWIKLCYMNQRSDDKLMIFK